MAKPVLFAVGDDSVVGRHGDIRVDSKPGEARMRVRLPLDPDTKTEGKA